MTNPVSASLKSWLCTLIIVVIVLISFNIFFYHPKNFIKTRIRLKEAIVKNNTLNESEPSIVFLGSSLTRFGLESDIAIATKLFKNKHQKFHVLKVAIEDLDNKIVEKIKFFEYITKNPPAYLFIESNNLNLEIDQPEIQFYIKSSLDNMANFSKNIVGIAVNEDVDFDLDPSIKGPFYKDKFDTLDYCRLLLVKTVVRKFAQNKIANKAYSELIRRNTKIIFLDIPYSKGIEENYIDKNQKNELKNLLKQYKNNYGIECWKYPNVIRNHYYIDGGHLNYKGAKIYSEWFCNKFNMLK